MNERAQEIYRVYHERIAEALWEAFKVRGSKKDAYDQIGLRSEFFVNLKRGKVKSFKLDVLVPLLEARGIHAGAFIYNATRPDGAEPLDDRLLEISGEGGSERGSSTYIAAEDFLAIVDERMQGDDD